MVPPKEQHPSWGEPTDHTANEAIRLAHRALERFPAVIARHKYIAGGAAVSSSLVVLAGVAIARRMRSGQTAEEAVAAARAYWDDPDLTPETVGGLLGFAHSVVPATGRAIDLARLRAQRFNALRQLIAAGPDYQTC